MQLLVDAQAGQGYHYRVEKLRIVPSPQFLPADYYIEEHGPVASQAVERVPERLGFVLLEEEMSEPGESISEEGHGEKP